MRLQKLKKTERKFDELNLISTAAVNKSKFHNMMLNYTKLLPQDNKYIMKGMTQLIHFTTHHML